MAVATAPRISAAQFRMLDARLDFLQLVDGQLVVNFPTDDHQRLQSRLMLALGTWCEADPSRGDAFGVLAAWPGLYELYGPDVNWCSRETVAARRTDRDVLPDLCVEIRSPSTWHHDIGTKRERLEAAGVNELWLVDGDARTVRVLRRSHPDAGRFDVDERLRAPDTLTSPQLPGFELALSTLFKR